MAFEVEVGEDDVQADHERRILEGRRLRFHARDLDGHGVIELVEAAHAVIRRQRLGQCLHPRGDGHDRVGEFVCGAHRAILCARLRAHAGGRTLFVAHDV